MQWKKKYQLIMIFDFYIDKSLIRSVDNLTVY